MHRWQLDRLRERCSLQTHHRPSPWPAPHRVGRDGGGEVKHIVGFSGGIDSQACARWVLNRYPKENLAVSKRCDDGRDWWRGYIAGMQDVLNRIDEMKSESIDREASGK